MFNIFGKKKPTVQFVHFYPDSRVYLSCEEKLKNKPYDVIVPIADQQMQATIRVISYVKEQDLYEAEYLSPQEAIPYLIQLFPPPNQAPQEKRRSIRVKRGLRILSPYIPGFQALSIDISTTGLKLCCNGILEPGTHLTMRIELDKARVAALELEGEVRWHLATGRPNEFLMGIMFINLTHTQSAILEEYIDQLSQVEEGVLDSKAVVD